MAFWRFLKNCWRLLAHGRGQGIEELARRLDMPVAELQAVESSYLTFSIAKKSGGARVIQAPAATLKAIQRRLLRRVLDRLRCHPAATGFERGRSIVRNAQAHVGQAVVLRMDLKDFFPATRIRRIRRYFRKIGWNRQATRLLLRLCTHQGGLPQGAPVSPRLSNLVNHRLDARLTGLAARRTYRNPRTGKLHALEIGATYTRYADDLTFSFPSDDPKVIRYVIRRTKEIVRDEGYTLHLRKKLQIRRRHTCQMVTGLVVNDKVNLPRETRRWLRAVEHHHAHGRQTTLTAAQLTGWQAFRAMVNDARREGDYDERTGPKPPLDHDRPA